MLRMTAWVEQIAIRPRFSSARRGHLMITPPYLSPRRHPAFAERGLWNVCARDQLLRLDVGRPDHLSPLLGFLSHQLSEFGRRHRHGLAAEFGQTSLQLRIGQYRVHRLI